MKIWSLQAIAISILFTSPVLAQAGEAGGQLTQEMMDIFARGCGDDQGKDRCAPEVQADMRGYYGLESVEELAEAGSEVYRAMFVDGYGNEIVAVSFVRERGKAPYVDVRAPSRAPDEEQLLRTTVSPDRWWTVSGRSPSFDQKMAYEVAPEDGARTMCLHGSVVVVESAEANSPYVSSTIDFSQDGEEISETKIERPAPTIRRDTESACANGLAVPYAFDLAKEAMESLVECSNLKLDDFRNATNFLAACHRLRGDRLTAAQAISTIGKLQSFRSEDDIEDNPLLFVSWGEEAPTKYLADIAGGVPFYGQPTAISTTDVIVEGMLFYFDADGEEVPTHQAKLTVDLYEYASSFAVYSWTVSDKEPFVMPEGF